MKPDHKTIEKYRLSAEKEERLWDEAVFVFDSSALLDLYYLPKSARQKLYEEIFKKLPNRLWIPNHVQYEYLKNRESVILKSVGEKYEPLKDSVQKAGEKAISQLLGQIQVIQNNTSKNDRHPHIPQDKIEAYKVDIEALIEKAKIFENDVKNQIEMAESEIKDVKDNDDVLSVIENLFMTGAEYDFNRILKITEEGEHRYKYRIPPGYGDLEKKEKIGTQIFGDLILWNQILDYSKDDKRSVVFITNDITKGNDWCYPEKRKERIASPREELIKEIADHSGVEFWMYSFPQFLYEGNNRLKGTMKTETIDSFAHFISSQQNLGAHLIYKCDQCNKIHKYHQNEFDLEFAIESTDQRSMGAENQYVDEYEIVCECGNHVEIRFEIWEYPVGMHNYDSVEIDGAQLIESFPLTMNFHDESDEDIITCELCDGDMNFVDLYNSYSLENQYNKEHEYSKYKSAKSGECNYCGSLHIRCPKCGTANAFLNENENIECEGGCGITYRKISIPDREGFEEPHLAIVDHRIKKCEACGKEFIDENNTGTCQECEDKYNDE